MEAQEEAARKAMSLPVSEVLTLLVQSGTDADALVVLRHAQKLLHLEAERPVVHFRQERAGDTRRRYPVDASCVYKTPRTDMTTLAQALASKCLRSQRRGMGGSEMSVHTELASGGSGVGAGAGAGADASCATAWSHLRLFLCNLDTSCSHLQLQDASSSSSHYGYANGYANSGSSSYRSYFAAAVDTLLAQAPVFELPPWLLNAYLGESTAMAARRYEVPVVGVRVSSSVAGEEGAGTAGWSHSNEDLVQENARLVMQEDGSEGNGCGGVTFTARGSADPCGLVRLLLKHGQLAAAAAICTTIVNNMSVMYLTYSHEIEPDVNVNPHEQIQCLKRATSWLPYTLFDQVILQCGEQCANLQQERRVREAEACHQAQQKFEDTLEEFFKQMLQAEDKLSNYQRRYDNSNEMDTSRVYREQ